MDALSQSRRCAISDIVFDSIGELFLVCKMTGEMGLFDFNDFKESAKEVINMWGSCEDLSLIAVFESKL